MLIYPENPGELKEVKKIEESIKYLFTRPGSYAGADLLVARNLTERYKNLMKWEDQILSGPIYPTT